VDWREGGLRVGFARLEGKYEAGALNPRLAFELMKLMLNDVSVPSRSLLCAWDSTERTSLDALRMSSANLVVRSTDASWACSTACLKPSLGIRNCLGVEGRGGTWSAGGGAGGKEDRASESRLDKSWGRKCWRSSSHRRREGEAGSSMVARSEAEDTLERRDDFFTGRERLSAPFNVGRAWSNENGL
jgi:hypothetical protein